MPWSLAAWNILPSTSILTALVHSSKSANFGLMEIERSEGGEGRREKGEGRGKRQGIRKEGGQWDKKGEEKDQRRKRREGSWERIKGSGRG